MACSNSRRDSTNILDPSFHVCLIGDTLADNKELLKAIDYFGFPVVQSKSPVEFIKQGAEFATIYVLEEFEGDVYKELLKGGQRILGPTTVMQYAEKHEPLPNNIRPLYTTSMKNLVISFSGFRVKEELSYMVSLIHHMGGSIRRDFKVEKTTHLVASPASTTGEKHKYAVAWGIPIMSAQWVYEMWARRRDLKCNAADKEFMVYKLLPFVGCKMAFIGYQTDEKTHMAEVAAKNGGVVVPANDPSCTHIVVEDGQTVHSSDYRRDDHKQIYIVKNEWFWACIQMEAKAEERIYAFENPNITSSSITMPTRGNKRKRLDTVAHMLATEHDNELYALKPDIYCNRQSDLNGRLSISGASFLDATFSPEKSLDVSAEFKYPNLSMVKSPPLDMRTLSPRRQVCCELFQTENNYVGILNTIMTVFKEPLEDPNEQRGDPLLAPAEIKIIFGNLPPIFEIHQNLRNELASTVIHSWHDDHSIGALVLNHAPEFMRAYPPFVNFFEKTKEVLAKCDATKPRFHAFLKRCQSKPECGRQSLQELLIRPVQRLPSVILLLSDILKHTPKGHPDCDNLAAAIDALKNVMLHINEDKRKTEGQVAMFDIVNDIENCPANLLSSHRNLILKADMFEVTDMLTKRGCTITMFLFTDMLEICKKRSRAANHTLKSPSVTSLSGTIKHQSKSFKHIDLIPLSHVKRVVDITDTDECKNSFAIVTWSTKEVKEILFAFVLLDDVCKSDFLRTLCRQVANAVCKADTENLLTSIPPEQLAFNSNDSSTSSILSKAFSKTRDKLGRALSMRRTPTRKGLSRAVSTIISPLRNFGTPSNMQTLRLSSVTNLTETFESGSSLSSSPIGNKKLKASSLGVAAVNFL